MRFFFIWALFIPLLNAGTLTKHQFSDSKIFPGTTRDYWIYVPAQYDGSKPACLMVFQDGAGFVRDCSVDYDGYKTFQRWPSIASWEAYNLGQSKGTKGKAVVFNGRDKVFSGSVFELDNVYAF